MAGEINLNKLSVSINGQVYNIDKPEKIYDELGISIDRFIELLSRDAYCPTLDADPTYETTTYLDEDGSENDFQIGQFARVPEATQPGGYRMWQVVNVTDSGIEWVSWHMKMEESLLVITASVDEANSYAQAAYDKSNEAINTANVAKNAVATLEGLADTTEAQVTLAEQVTQIAQNTSDITQLKEKHILISEEEFDALEVLDGEKIYMIYEE